MRDYAHTLSDFLVPTLSIRLAARSLRGTFEAGPTYEGMPWHNPPRFRRPTPAGFIVPCRPTLVRAPPVGPGWLHEVKHDGFRTLARKQGERVDVWSRYGTDFTAKFLNIAAAVAALPAEDALIDGEAVAFVPGGHSDFGALRTKGPRARLLGRLRPSQPRGRRSSPTPARGAAKGALAPGRRGRRHSVQRIGRWRGRDCVRPRLPAGPRGHRVEEGRQPLQKRGEPQLAQVPQPGV
jgi:ATP dependent DNA ligase domain